MTFAIQLDNLLKHNLDFCKQLHNDSMIEDVDIDFVNNNIEYEYIVADEYDVIVKFTNPEKEFLYVRLCGRYIDKYYGKSFTHYMFTKPEIVTITTYVDYIL